MYKQSVLPFPPTTPLVLPFGVAVSFNLLDFVRVSVNAAEFRATFDFGDGTVLTVDGARGIVAPVSKTYEAPGRYTLRIQLRVDTTLFERYSWPVQVACSAADFAPDSASLSFLAAVQASLDLPGGRRQLYVPLPAASSYEYGSSSYTGGSGAIPPTKDEFGAGLVAFARSFQQSYALGFGRVPIPTTVIQRAAYAHLANDVLAYGTSSCLQSDIHLVESALRDVMEGPSRTDAMAAMKSGIDALSTLYRDMRTLGRLSITSGDVLIVGDRSICLGDVETWYAAATTSVDEETLLSNLTTREWRQLNREYDGALPKPDMTSAWYWECAQAVAQAIDALYAGMGRRSESSRARAFLVAGCEDGLCSLRVYDDELQFWAQVAAAPGGPSWHLTLAEMSNDQLGQAPPAHPSHVSVRTVGVRGTDHGPCTDLAYLFDARRIEASLEGRLFARHPSFLTMPTGIAKADELPLQPTGRKVLVDGSVLLAADSESTLAMTVGLQPLVLPTGKDSWSALTPHALLSLFRRKGKA